MRDNPLVSVIVPAYNAERYIAECLESVKSQTFADFECIVVNDGSTDSTSEIAQRFTATDGRFRLISLNNGGVSRARNIGIDNAKGDLITFVDADDILHPQALESMISVSAKYEADVVIVGFKKFQNTPSEDRFGKNKLEVYGYVDAMRKALYQKRLFNSPWGVLMKRPSPGVGDRFTEGIRYEDLDAFYRFYEKANRIVYIDRVLYHYRHNPKSFINTWSDGRLDVLDVTDRMKDFFESGYPQLADAAGDRRFSAHFNILLLMMKNGVNNPEAMKRCWEVIKEGRRKAILDPNVRLKNKAGALASFGGKALLRKLSRLI